MRRRFLASGPPLGKDEASQTPVTVSDVIENVFGQDAAEGGFRIVGDGPVAGSVYVYDRNGPHGVSLEAAPIEGQILEQWILLGE